MNSNSQEKDSSQSSVIEYLPEICNHCGQTLDYEARLSKGHCYIVIALINAQQRLGKKEVSFSNEMADMLSNYKSKFEMAMLGKMDLSMIHNYHVPEYHGLIAKGSETGKWLVTPKGAKFLRGEPVIRTAIVNKKNHSKKYYLNEKDLVTLPELMKGQSMPLWDGEFAKIRKLAAYIEAREAVPTLFD